jgi:uncharacterized protein YjiS (DUF1127 family)
MEVAMTAIVKIASVNSRKRTAFARVLRAAAGAVDRVLRRVLEAAKHRKDMALLARADDRMLADIGLTRSDLRDAFAGRVWEDPTILLRTRALERRLGRSGVVHGFPPPAYHEGAAASRPGRAPKSGIAAPSISPAIPFRRPTDRSAHLTA